MQLLTFLKAFVLIILLPLLVPPVLLDLAVFVLPVLVLVFPILLFVLPVFVLLGLPAQVLPVLVLVFIALVDHVLVLLVFLFQCSCSF